MPVLGNYTGPSALVPVLLSGSPMQAVSLRWPRWEFSHSELVLNHLIRLASPFGIPVFQNLFFGWPPLSAITLIASSLNVTSLSLISAELPDPEGSSYDELLAGFAKILPQFKCLLSVRIDSGRADRVTPSVDFDDELLRMQDWGKRSPTLVSCTLISRVRWDRIGKRTEVWLPADQPRELVNPWLSRTLTSKGTQGTADFLADIRDILVEVNPDRLDETTPLLIQSLVIMPRLTAIQVLLTDISEGEVDFLFGLSEYYCLFFS
ncbi:hypothetical protein B0H10DRAFT_1957300 [Mycena sp. CBHHK59/15]|nr:hypothetical protein B0H10DRAFT_1957300 [Mycena sp. CBHHK59/15]